MTRDRKTVVLGLLFIGAGCFSHSEGTVRMATPKASSMNNEDAPEVIALACSAERPVIQPGESVVLRAWAKSFSGQELNYTWTVAVGKVAGSGHEVTWILKGVEAGIYKAEAALRGDTGLPATCSIRVAIVEPERGAQVVRASARSYLVKDNKEAEGYGLYSYLLFGAPPTDETRKRYVKALEAYLRFIDASEFEEEAYPRSKLNITYLPLKQAGTENVNVTWLLEDYDYARARILLDTLPGDRKPGIYFVSSLKPLTHGPNPPYLVQDLSAVPTSPDGLIGWWVDEFLRQASQEHFWEASTTKQMALRMRTTIAVLAVGLPEVQKSLDSWIAWIH